MSELLHQLGQAASDLAIGPDQSVVLVTQAPRRWDELLDTRLPLLVSSSVGDWTELGEALWLAGCPLERQLRLVESNGRVIPLHWEEQRLEPSPLGPGWALAIGWNHENEGWRARLPLWNRFYVVTRAAEQSALLVDKLQELGAKALSIPTIEFAEPDDLRPWVQAVEQLPQFDWILFTSPNGVDYFVRRLRQAGLDLRSLAQAKLACIGPATAKRLDGHGLKTDLLPKDFVAEGLLEALCVRLGTNIEGCRILLPRAQVARHVLPKRLIERGASVLVAPVYKTIAPAFPELGALVNLVPRVIFTSSSTVNNWVQGLQDLEPEVFSAARDWPCFCIGPITEQTALEHRLKVLGTATTYTVEGLLEMIAREDLNISAPKG